MENLVVTLTVPALREVLRQEIESIISNNCLITSSIEEDKLFSIDQAANFLCLSKHTVYSLVSRGSIPHSKRGKRLYFSSEELKNWVKEGKKKTFMELKHEAEIQMLTQNSKRNVK